MTGEEESLQAADKCKGVLGWILVLEEHRCIQSATAPMRVFSCKGALQNEVTSALCAQGNA